MAARHDLVDWVHEALVKSGGSATVTEVAKHIWEHHETELKKSGDLFFTWQYDMRWAAQSLRNQVKATAARNGTAGVWSIK